MNSVKNLLSTVMILCGRFSYSIQAISYSVYIFRNIPDVESWENRGRDI